MPTWQEQQAGSDPSGGPVAAAPPAPAATPPGPGATPDLKQAAYAALARAEKILTDAQAALQAAQNDPNKAYMIPELQKAVVDALGSYNAALSAAGKAANPDATKPAAGTDLGYTLETITTSQGKRNVRVYWKADGSGGKIVDTSKGDKGVEDTGSAESAVDAATAQVRLQQLQQALAAENDPLKKEQLRIQVQQAQFNLDQARSKAPLDQATAQLNYDRAKAAYEQETSPEAKEQKRVALEQARVALQQAQQNLNKPTESTQDGYLVRVAPGGELTRVDLLTPEQRRLKDEDDAFKREQASRGTLPTNAYAALQQETQRLQGAASAERDRLVEQQRRGELSAEQAERRFQDWLGPRQSALAGLRASAEEAQRAERATIEERNRQDEIRVGEANRRREETAQQYGETARRELISTFPSARSAEFAQAYGANVAAMSQRAQGRTAEERMAAPRSPGYTPQALDASRIQAVMPSPDAIAAAARQRALAAIAPAVALRAGFNAPALPSAPDIQGLLGSLPYRGPLLAAPMPGTGLLPTPGRDAVDLGPTGQPGYARTYYGPNGEVYGPDWRIPG